MVFFGILFIMVPLLRPITVVVFLALCWGACRFGYVNTRYSTHCIIMQAIPLLITLGLCVPLLFSISRKDLGWSWPAALGLAATPALVVIAAVWWAWSRKLAQPLYRFAKDRVHPIEGGHTKPVPWLWIGAGIGLLSVAKPYTIDLLPAPYIVCGLCTVMCLVVVWYGRHNIAGLRYLRARERREGIAYAFGNLEEIQAARARKWAARAFIALDSALSRFVRKLGATLGR